MSKFDTVFPKYYYLINKRRKIGINVKSRLIETWNNSDEKNILPFETFTSGKID